MVRQLVTDRGGRPAEQASANGAGFDHGDPPLTVPDMQRLALQRNGSGGGELAIDFEAAEICPPGRPQTVPALGYFPGSLTPPPTSSIGVQPPPAGPSPTPPPQLSSTPPPEPPTH